MLDILFKNISVADGTGNAAEVKDVGVKDGRITFQYGDAKEVIDGTGLTLTPGFIDVHSHDDYCIGCYPAAICKIGQGITTEVVGNCGDSAYPVNPARKNEMGVFANMTTNLLEMPYETFTDLDGYAAYSETVPMPINMATLIGHNCLRFAVMGTADRKPTPEEMEQMKALLKTCMEQGAYGLSTGLVYIPGVYADEEEIIELCKVIAPYGGIYATHMRDEAKYLVRSVEESIRIAETAGVKLEISHFKARGKQNWGSGKEAIRKIEEAVKRGVQIEFDLYPYEANMSGVSVCIPPKYFARGMDQLLEDLKDDAFRRQVFAEMADPDCKYDNFYQCAGGFEHILITTSPAMPEAEGKTIAEHARMLGKKPEDAFFDALIANKGVYNGIFFSMDEKEMEAIYCHPLAVAGTDGLCFDVGVSGHPRTWNTFVRTLETYADKKGLLSFEEAVRKQTFNPCRYWGLEGKGLIAEGYDADLVLMDRTKLKEVATYSDPNRNPEGILAVYVSGKCQYKDGKIAAETCGSILRKTAGRDVPSLPKTANQERPY